MKVHILLLPLSSLFILSSCHEKEKENKNKYTCSNLYEQFDPNTNKISNGCENDVNEKLGSNSTVLVITKKNSEIKDSLCTGVAIASHTVLTAAHCVYNGNDIIIKESESSKISLSGKAIVNKLYMTNPDPKTQNSNSTYVPFGDIAVVKTSLPLNIINIVPAKITTKFYNEDKLFTIGFGQLKDKDNSSASIKRWTVTKAHVPEKLITLNALQSAHFNHSKNDNQVNRKVVTNVSDTFIILKRMLGQTCGGDSGGPHFRNINGISAVVGITQGMFSTVIGAQTIYSNDDCTANDSIATYIYPYLNWIENNLSKSEKLSVIN